MNKTDIEQSTSPESLFNAIEKCIGSEDTSYGSAYNDARKTVIRFRKVYSKLPDLPDHKENAVAGLHEVMDWCIQAIDILNCMTDDMDSSVIEGFICQLKKLKGLPVLRFPKIDEETFKKAQNRAQKIVAKYQSGKKIPKRLNRYGYYWNQNNFTESANIISRLVEVANRRTKGPDMRGSLVGGKWVPTTPDNIELYHTETEINFARATEKIYRLIDSDYSAALIELEDSIFVQFKELSKLNKTNTGIMLNKYDELKDLDLRDRFKRLETVYSIDSLVSTVWFPDYGLARYDTREKLVDGLIETLDKISRRIKPNTQETQGMIKLFISHSSEDQEFVEILIELLKNSLCLPSNEIRCTSIDGYRLPGGANTNEQLKSEVLGTKAFIGLISHAAIDSMFVLFELGARWGSDKHLLPLLAPGVPSKILKEPLKNLNALNCNSSSQLHQLVKDIGSVLEIKPEDPQAYQRYIDRIINMPHPEDKKSSENNQDAIKPAFGLTDIQIQIMKAVAGIQNEQVTVSDVSRITGLSNMETQYNLDELARNHEFLNWFGNMNPDTPTRYTLTHKGRGFILTQNS